MHSVPTLQFTIEHEFTIAGFTNTRSLLYTRRPTALRERRKEKSIRDREKTQGETAGEEEEIDWEEAGKERREDA